MSSARPTISSADGRSSIALRSVVQLDAAHYGEDADRGAAIDFRRGSVGAVANRESAAARDFSDGAYFRRARSASRAPWLATSATAWWRRSAAPAPKDRRASTTSGSATRASRRSRSRSAHLAAGQHGRRHQRRELALHRARRALRAVAHAGRRRRSHRHWPARQRRALDERADAHHANGQRCRGVRFAARSRGALRRTACDLLRLQRPRGLSGTWVFQPPDQGSTAAAGQRHGVRLRDRPEIRVDSTRLVDTGPIDADSAYVYGARGRRELEELVPAGRELPLRDRADRGDHDAGGSRRSTGSTSREAGC